MVPPMKSAEALKLFWVTTRHHTNDWFVVAPTKELAEEFMLDFEPEYSSKAELIQDLPAAFQEPRTALAVRKGFGLENWQRRGVGWPRLEIFESLDHSRYRMVSSRPGPFVIFDEAEPRLFTEGAGRFSCSLSPALMGDDGSPLSPTLRA